MLRPVAVAVHRRLARRPRTALLLSLLLLAAVSAGSARLHVRRDVLSLLASRADDPYAEAARLLDTFGTIDTLLIDVSRPGVIGAELARSADSLVEKLDATGEFRQIAFRADRGASRRLFETLFEARFQLFPPPTDLAPGLHAVQRDLMGAGSAVLEPIVLRDPLDHRGRILDRIAAALPAMRLDTSDGTLMSVDGAHALIIAEPRAAALDPPAAGRLLARVRRAVPRGLVVETFGAHVYATAAAHAMRDDVWLTAGSSALSVLALYLLVFRRLGEALAVLVPVGFGLGVAAGLFGWAGRSVHGLTLGFSAVILGITVDYGTHLVVHYRARRQEHAGEPHAEAVVHVLSRVSGSLWAAAATTVVGFAALVVSGAPVLRELALLAVIGVAVSYGVAVTLLPLLLPRLVADSAPRSASTPRWARLRERLGSRAASLTVVVAVLAFTLAIAAGIGRVRFDGDLRALDYRYPELHARERPFAQRYAMGRQPTFVVAQGTTLELALQKSDAVLAVLERAKAKGLLASFTSPSALLPSERLQLENLRGYRRDAIEQSLFEAAGRTDVRAEVFGPFFIDLAKARGLPVPLRASDLSSTPVAPLMQRALHSDATGGRVLHLVYPPAGTDAPDDLAPALRTALLRIDGVRVASRAGLATEAVDRIKDSLAVLSSLAAALIVLVLAVHYRRAGPILWALLPVGAGLVWGGGAMGLLGIPLNVVTVGAFAMASGLAVDYGIFAVDAIDWDTLDASGATPLALTLAAGSTLAGFASLLLAKSPVLWSLGLAVSVCVVAGLLTSVLFMPALGRLGWGPMRGVVCARCGASMRRRGARSIGLRVAVAGLLALALAIAWLSGARATGGWFVAAVLSADLVYAAWLVRRLVGQPWICGCS